MTFKCESIGGAVPEVRKLRYEALKMNIIPQEFSLTKSDYNHKYGHKSCCLWFTGLSGSGKSTLANAVNNYLHDNDYKSYVLDGDNVRLGLNSNLGFSDEDRSENIRRTGEVAKLFVNAGIIVSTSFISPFIADRDRVRSMFDDGDFIEIFIKCSFEKCAERDVKGLYKKALNGEIKEFTGITSPYEEPLNPELTVDTENETLDESSKKVLDYLINVKKLKSI